MRPTCYWFLLGPERLIAIEHFGANGVLLPASVSDIRCIGQIFGGEVVFAPQIMHGKTTNPSASSQDSRTPSLTRYHSLKLSTLASVPEVLEVTAQTSDGVVMGLRHRTLPIEGVQFHPESILTTAGHHLLGNFLGKAQARTRS